MYDVLPIHMVHNYHHILTHQQLRSNEDWRPLIDYFRTGSIPIEATIGYQLSV